MKSEISRIQTWVRLILFSMMVVLCFEVRADDSWEIQDSEIESLELRGNVKDQALPENEFLQTRSGKVFVLDYANLDKDSLHRYHEMSATEKKSFHSMRLGFLKILGAVLNSQKLTLGAGIATKNRLVAVQKKDPSKKQTFSELGHDSIEQILNGVNHRLWSKAAKVAASNEVSFAMIGSAQVLAAMPNKQEAQELNLPQWASLNKRFSFGGALGLGIAVGYNRQTERLYFDVLLNTEKINKGLSFFAGVRGTLGLIFDAHDTVLDDVRTRKSKMYAPPIVPVWEMNGQDRYGFGVGIVLGLPPPPVTEPFTYETYNHQFRLLRISISTVFFQRAAFVASEISAAPRWMIEKCRDLMDPQWRTLRCERGLLDKL